MISKPRTTVHTHIHNNMPNCKHPKVATAVSFHVDGINHFNEMVNKENLASKDDNITCRLCNTNINARNKYVTLKCCEKGHRFHKSCMQYHTQMTHKNECPKCANMVESNKNKMLNIEMERLTKNLAGMNVETAEIKTLKNKLKTCEDENKKMKEENEKMKALMERMMKAIKMKDCKIKQQEKMIEELSNIGDYEYKLDN